MAAFKKHAPDVATTLNICLTPVLVKAKLDCHWVCHYLVNVAKKLREIKLTFAGQGHSYTKCDKDVGAINQKYAADEGGGLVAQLVVQWVINQEVGSEIPGNSRIFPHFLHRVALGKPFTPTTFSSVLQTGLSEA